MDKNFFVMMYSQHGTTAMPITDENDGVRFYASSEDAHAEMKDHRFASAFGYEVFEMGTSEL